MHKMKIASAAFASVVAAALPVMAADQGVSDTEIVIGSHNDLSGPFAAFGAPAMTAAQLYFDEVNANGGIHGRKIRLIVEDHGYQMPKAQQAINKLVNRDKVFAMFLPLGTPMNIAAFRILDKKGIPNFNPLSAARQMLQDPVDLKFTGFSTYYAGIRSGVKYLIEKEGSKNICAMYIPSDFGKEIQAGAKDQAAASGAEYLAETTHKPDETDYVGSLGKMKAAGCDTITIALSIRGTITVVATAKKMGWSEVKFIGSSAAFHTAVAKVKGGITEGFMAVAGWQDLEGLMGDEKVKGWVEKFTAATGKPPGTGAVLGRSGAETFARAIEAAGPDLTVASFKKGVESLDFYDAISGNQATYRPDKHEGSSTNFLSIVKGGKWEVMASGISHE